MSSNTGFSATISTAAVYYMSSSCPGPTTITVSAYAAMSLTSSSSYNNNMDCSVILYSGSSSQSVQLQFTSFSTGANADFLYIRDGNTSSSPLLSQLSGSYSYNFPSVVSSGPYLHLRFISDAYNTYSGFATSFETAAITAPVYTMSSNCPGPTFVTTPGFSSVSVVGSASSTYPASMDCAVVISSGQNSSSVVQLTLQSFGTRSGYDYLYVYNGQSTSYALLASLTGAMSSLSATTFTSTGQYLYLRFTSSSYTPLSSNTGFSATISTAAVYYMSSSCPGPTTITVSAYAAISLTSASSYNNNMDCSVVLYSGSSSQSVQLVFNTFSTGYNSDILYIRDGNTSSSLLLSQMSGSYSNGQTYV